MIPSTDGPPLYDVHHHWVNEKGYIGRLLGEMDRLGIERTGLVAMGPILPGLFVQGEPGEKAPGNAELAELLKTHGDRFWGWGFIRPGRHNAEEVDRLAEMGMDGLKFHLPLKPYGSEEYFPIYERAEQHGMPCLFHTGIFYPPRPMRGMGIRSENCRPIHLEPIAQEFTDLTLIAAHLGVCWNEEAATLCRICPNIHADLSGRLDGWRSSRSIEWFRRTLYWPTAHRKILFGSDVHADEIESTLGDQRRIFRQMGWSEEQRADVFGGNAKRILERSPGS